jgi:hypothetical protein
MFFAWLARFGRRLARFGRRFARFERRLAAFDWRLAAFDVVVWFLALYYATGRWLSAVFAAHWDPFGFSRRPIPVGAAPPRGRLSTYRPLPRCSGNPRTFTVDNPHNERTRRIVAWFYRWHSTPSADDWRDCLTLFRLAAVPPHYLAFDSDDGELICVQIHLEDDTRRVTYCDVYGQAIVHPIAGPIELGSLCPRRLREDATRADATRADA